MVVAQKFLGSIGRIPIANNVHEVLGCPTDIEAARVASQGAELAHTRRKGRSDGCCVGVPQSRGRDDDVAPEARRQADEARDRDKILRLKGIDFINDQICTR
jgi:hypothetical protein